MLTLNTLKRKAQMSTALRGHRMRWIRPVAGVNVQTGVCLRCDATVHLHTTPAPNEIEIGGEAVALTCPAPVPS